MKLFKSGLRMWITAVSVASFLGGWIMFVHSPKPYRSSLPSDGILPTLEPLPPLFGPNDIGRQDQPLFAFQPGNRSNIGMPLFRTGGS